MACIVEPTPVGALQFRKAGFWHKLSIVFWQKRERVPRLYPRELSDHLKRDLGFLDGR